MSWNDPDVIAAMEALKAEEPAPAERLAVVQRLVDLAARVGGLDNATHARVIDLLAPVFLDMKAAVEKRDSSTYHPMSAGMLRALGFAFGGCMLYVPPASRQDAIRLFFANANVEGRIAFDIDVTTVDVTPPGEPKK